MTQVVYVSMGTDESLKALAENALATVPDIGDVEVIVTAIEPEGDEVPTRALVRASVIVPRDGVTPKAYAVGMVTHELMNDALSFGFCLRDIAAIARDHQRTAPLP